MRFAVLVSAAALVSIAPVLAQTPGPIALPPSPPSQASVITRPDWSRLPTGDDLSRYYPERAQRLGIGGKAVIQCFVSEKGTLEQCVVVSESPPDAEFGAAAIRMSRLFRMKPKTRDGLPVTGGLVRVPIIFSPPPAEEDDTPLVIANLARSLPIDGRYIGIFPPGEPTNEALLPYIRLPDAPDRRQTIETRIFSVTLTPAYSRKGLYAFTDARVAFDCVRHRKRIIGTSYFAPNGELLGTDPGGRWATVRKAKGRAGWDFRAMTVACSGQTGPWPLRDGVEGVIRAVRGGEGPRPSIPTAMPLLIPPVPATR